MGVMIRRYEPWTPGKTRAILNAIINTGTSETVEDMDMKRKLVKIEEFMNKYGPGAGEPLHEDLGATVIIGLCVKDERALGFGHNRHAMRRSKGANLAFIERRRDTFGGARPLDADNHEVGLGRPRRLRTGRRRHSRASALSDQSPPRRRAAAKAHGKITPSYMRGCAHRPPATAAHPSGQFRQHRRFAGKHRPILVDLCNCWSTLHPTQPYLAQAGLFWHANSRLPECLSDNCWASGNCRAPATADLAWIARDYPREHYAKTIFCSRCGT